MTAKSNKNPASALVVFAKPPRPGRVKTRLIPALGAAAAAGLYAAFLADTISELRRIEGLGAAQGCPVKLHLAWHSPPQPADLDLPGEAAIPALLQRGQNLGERLHHAFVDLFEAGCARVAAVGSDMPLLTAEGALAGLLALDSHDVAIGPSADGGYWLLAAKSPHAQLFQNIDWGTGRVLQQTLAAARQNRLSVQLLEEGYDVDTPAALRRLQHDLARSDAARRLCANTVNFLKEHKVT